MKTKEELNKLKEEVENLHMKLAELTEDELQQVSGGVKKMPEIRQDEKYVLLPNVGRSEPATRKDLYENIILGG